MRKTRRKALVLPAFVMRATTAGSMTGERSRSRKAKLRVAASPRLVPGLEECSDEELIRLDELSTEIVVARGRTLAARGSGPLQTVIVYDGYAGLVSDGAAHRRLGPGTCIGGGIGDDTTVVALTPMRVLVLNAGEFATLSRECAGLVARVGASPSAVGAGLRSNRVLAFA